MGDAYSNLTLLIALLGAFLLMVLLFYVLPLIVDCLRGEEDS